jgi:hypothetical protein
VKLSGGGGPRETYKEVYIKRKYVEVSFMSLSLICVNECEWIPLTGLRTY